MRSPAARLLVHGCVVAALALSLASEMHAQITPLLRLDPADSYGGPLSIDRGIVGLRQRLMELRTTASVMQITAHPDDEQAGLLTYFSRGTGARTALLSLNRGEAGANAIGPELFDALGMLRTEELIAASRYYGVDDLYFTSAVDYGFSKSMNEAARSWDTTTVLADMVRIIRENRPVVVISRWYGGTRDGHGQHQLAGVLTPDAVAAAADPTRFPGLPPWRVHRVFRSNLPTGERAEVVIDVGRRDSVLDRSYQSLGLIGYALQRSQGTGQRTASEGPAPQRLQVIAGAPMPVGDDPFLAIDTSLPGLFALHGEAEPPGVRARLADVDSLAKTALDSLRPETPWAIVPHLSRGHQILSDLWRLPVTGVSQSMQAIAVKLVQFERAIATALGLEVEAMAAPLADDRVVPGDSLFVEVTVRQSSPLEVQATEALVGTYPVSNVLSDYRASGVLNVVADAPSRTWKHANVPAASEMVNRPTFSRSSIARDMYAVANPAGLASAIPLDPLSAFVMVRVAGTNLLIHRPVRAAISDNARPLARRRLSVVPPVSLHLRQTAGIITGRDARRVRTTLTLRGHSATPVTVHVALVASGQRITREESVHVALNERRTIDFEVPVPADADSLVLSATARIGNATWDDDITDIVHADLEPTRLYTKATARIRRVPVTLRPGLRVGYIMGVGDLVPDAIAQLGASVTLLDSAQLSSGSLARYDAIVVGTRAYAVRDDLVRATPALIEWARRGGNLVVLYQTQEFKPETMAPFRASLPANAEEVTEQDAVVSLLRPEHAMLTTPNRITTRDFDGWIEQRGSKFLTQLAPEYTPLVETHDTGQAPQEGIWVTANVGRGRWTYVALALHRQLPYAVPGAYRILANLLSVPRVR